MKCPWWQHENENCAKVFQECAPPWHRRAANAALRAAQPPNCVLSAPTRRSYPPALFRVLTLRSSALFWVTRIIEEHTQFDAAMSRLWKVRGTAVPRVQIRRGVVRGEEHQPIEEVQHDALILGSKCGKGI